MTKLQTAFQPLGLFDVILTSVPPIDDRAFLDDETIPWFLIRRTETLNAFQRWSDRIIIVLSEAAPCGRPLDPLWTQRAKGRIVFVSEEATIDLPEGSILELNVRLRLFRASLERY